MREFAGCVSSVLNRFLLIGGALLCCMLAGCATPQPSQRAMRDPAPLDSQAAVGQPAFPVVRASFEEDLPAPRWADEHPLHGAGPAPELALPDLIDVTLDSHPRLGQVGWAVESARGQAIQAGLYPNPTLNLTGNELSDRTGPAGIWSAYATQEIVAANKLGLSKAAALKEVDQAMLNVIAERYRVFTEVRQAYFEAVTLQQRVEILADLVELAEQSVANSQKLMQAKEIAELDLVQLEVDLERYRADLEATQRELPAAYRRLAASMGAQDMPIGRVSGDLNLPPPDYDLEQVRLYVLGIHPELRSAEIGAERARLVLSRAQAEPFPNVTVGAGYTYQGQNRSNDWDIGVSVPIPVWNKNQGAILAAKAQVGEAVNEVGRVQNDLVTRLSTAFRTYAAARQRAERYRTAILPKAQRTYELSLKAYQGGQFEYLRVLAAQRAVVEANLELIRSLGEMWQAASEIAGLMLEDRWPCAPPQHGLEQYDAEGKPHEDREAFDTQARLGDRHRRRGRDGRLPDARLLAASTLAGPHGRPFALG